MAEGPFRTEDGTFDNRLLDLVEGFLCDVVNDPNRDIHIALDSVRLLRALEMWGTDRKEAEKLLQDSWIRKYPREH